MFGGGRLSVDLLLPGAMSGRQNEGRNKYNKINKAV